MKWSFEVFNAVVRLCLVEMIPAFRRVLKCQADDKLNLEKRKKWTKLRMHVKSYLADVIRVMICFISIHASDFIFAVASRVVDRIHLIGRTFEAYASAHTVLRCLH